MKFSYKSNIKKKNLIKIFENYPLLLKISPPQIKYDILDKSSGLVQQTLFVKSIKKEFNFQTIHTKSSDDSFLIKIISGPLKGTETTIKISDKSKHTEIHVNLNLKLGLKYKIFSSILSKKIKSVNISLFNRLEKFGQLLFNERYTIEFENNFNTLILNIENKKLYFDGWWLGDIWSCFIGDTYDKFPILNKTIIDVGVNIADTAISFIHKGAKKVIGLEPFPINYEFAEKNISKNNMNEDIINILGGCSSDSSEILVDPNLSGLGYKMEKMDIGEKIKQFSLEDLVNKFEINNGVIKMNCEGCEYDSIINTSSKTLKKFSHILIQYHDGSDILSEKLTNAGFSVVIDPYTESKGQLIAENNN